MPGKFHEQRSLAAYSPWVTKSQAQLITHASRFIRSFSWTALATSFGEKPWDVAVGPGWGGAETLMRDVRGIWEGSLVKAWLARESKVNKRSETEIRKMAGPFSNCLH